MFTTTSYEVLLFSYSAARISWQLSVFPFSYINSSLFSPISISRTIYQSTFFRTINQPSNSKTPNHISQHNAAPIDLYRHGCFCGDRHICRYQCLLSNLWREARLRWSRKFNCSINSFFFSIDANEVGHCRNSSRKMMVAGLAARSMGRHLNPALTTEG